MFVYRNRNTGDEFAFPQRDPDLDNRANFELVTDAEPSDMAKVAAERAAAQQASIEQAATARLDNTKGLADGSISESEARERTLPGAAQPVPTASAMTAVAPTEAPPLAKALEEGREAVAQIGPNPHEHPATPAEVAEQAAWEAEHPPTGGVLKRRADAMRRGAGQIGHDPEVHPVGPEEVAAQAAWERDNPPAGGVLERRSRASRADAKTKKADKADKGGKDSKDS